MNLSVCRSAPATSRNDEKSQALARESVADESDHASTRWHDKFLTDRRARGGIDGRAEAVELDTVVNRYHFFRREIELPNQIVANEIRYRDHALQAGTAEALPFDQHLHPMIRTYSHRSRAERAAPFSRRAEVTGVSAAARSHHVRAGASRKAEHQLGASATRRGSSGPCESEQRQRASQPRTGARPTDLPVAGRSADLIGENRHLMSGCAQALRRHDQIALGAAARAIETPTQQRYPHRTTLGGDDRKRCALPCRVIICRARGEAVE